ncbi:MAG: alpha/beta fold hydrolase [Gammaproteobacteria bacterium]|nr:alpha/beta fold hydrolase [Gammaproteobacteria bacterium]
MEAKGTAVLVHGLWMPGWETWLLRRRLEAAGYRTTGFVYPTVGCGLDENADRLAAFAEQLPQDPVHFVGHSLGGALIVRLFERHGVGRGGRIVCLGSPLNGSRPGRLLDAHPLGRRIVGRCVHDLLACGGCDPWNGMRELGIIAGDVPLGMGRLLGGLASPNDGTVAVEETRLAGATDHVVLHCTHMSMLWSRPVAEQVVRFLQAGRFDRA